MDEEKKTKAQRLELIVARLQNSHPASDEQGARELVDRVVNEVEDQYSGVEARPNEDLNDGRLYPPAERFRSKDSTHDVSCFKLKGHYIFFGVNGSIRITDRQKQLVLDKPGADERSVSDLLNN